MSFFFLDFFTAKKSYLSGPLKSFHRPKWQISLPFHILRLAKFLHRKTDRGTPFGGYLPSTGSTPPGPRKEINLITTNDAFIDHKVNGLRVSFLFKEWWSHQKFSPAVRLVRYLIWSKKALKYLTNSYTAPFGVKCNWADAQKNRICLLNLRPL